MSEMKNSRIPLHHSYTLEQLIELFKIKTKNKLLEGIHLDLTETENKQDLDLILF